MKNRIFSHLRMLFVISLCLCMILGAALTLAQFIGVLLQMPQLLVMSEALLLKPAIAASAAFGLLSFLASYFQPGGQGHDEELEEI